MDLSTVDIGEVTGNEVCCTQNPEYEAGQTKNRESALRAVVSYVSCRELSESSLLLYQVENSWTPQSQCRYAQTCLTSGSLATISLQSLCHYFCLQVLDPVGQGVRPRYLAGKQWGFVA